MLIGKRINGRYKILDMIGGGGMANVYLAHDMILDRDVAVKMLRLDLTNDEEFIRRFHREAQSATSLNHPNIVNIYDVGEENDLYYIVMEFVDGQTLKQYIQQYSPIRVEEAVGIMSQLTSAIAHAHQNHIVHRDIKPHNILVDRNGKVKITDFGIAMALSATSITQTNSVLGSVHYLSPEQARGGMANKKSDIYSLGIVMFELITGRLPFSGESAVSIALKHLQSETPSLRRWNTNIPQSVENIVLKATAKDPFHRYNNVEEMGEDLRTALFPERFHESKFMIPEDNDATKAIPIITNDRPLQNLDETMVHKQEKKNQKTKDQQAKGKDKQKRKKWPVILISSFVTLVILGLLTVFALPGWLEPKEIEVPNVSGKNLDDAVAILVSKGFKIGETKDIANDDVKKGKIIRTSPEAGSTANEGSEIDIFKSAGKEKLTLLDYVGRQYDSVFPLLESKNFKDIVKNEVYDDSVPGTIVKQNPEAGGKVTPETTILEFDVSKGPEKIILKDLTQYTEKAAQDYAETTSLTIDTSKQEYHDTIPAGMIISQSPSAGTEMEKGDKLTVVISKGKEAKPPKTIKKEIIVPYDPSVPGQPQEVKIYIDDMTHNITELYDTIFITQTLKKQIELTIQEGQKAEYKVIRDNKVFIDEPVDYNAAE
jgi:eukaryotic-like serine/threonine-protein kinase